MRSFFGSVRLYWIADGIQLFFMANRDDSFN